MGEVVDIDKKVTEIKCKFYEALNNATVRANSDLITADKCGNLVQECKVVKKSEKKNLKHYWLMKHYDVIEVQDVRKTNCVYGFSHY